MDIYLRIEHYIEFSIQRGRKWVCKNKNPILEINVGNIDGAIRSRKSKRNRQHNCQKKKYKRTNKDLQNIHIKLKIEYHEPH